MCEMETPLFQSPSVEVSITAAMFLPNLHGGLLLCWAGEVKEAGGVPTEEAAPELKILKISSASSDDFKAVWD